MAYELDLQAKIDPLARQLIEDGKIDHLILHHGRLNRKAVRKSKNLGPVFDPELRSARAHGRGQTKGGPALVHPKGVKFAKRRRKEVMPVFERPYLKRNPSRLDRRDDPIFGVYDDEPLGICFEFFKPQILGRRLPSQ